MVTGPGPGRGQEGHGLGLASSSAPSPNEVSHLGTGWHNSTELNCVSLNVDGKLPVFIWTWVLITSLYTF